MRICRNAKKFRSVKTLRLKSSGHSPGFDWYRNAVDMPSCFRTAAASSGLAMTARRLGSSNKRLAVVFVQALGSDTYGCSTIMTEACKIDAGQ